MLGMNLSHGGHLTHGSPVNMSGKYYNFVAYGVDPETEMIDYDEVRRLTLAAQTQDDRCRRIRIPACDRFCKTARNRG